MKTCTKCGVPKEEGEFYIRTSTGRPRPDCKSCAVVSAGSWAKDNRDACNESNRRYRNSNLEETREYSKLAQRKHRAAKRLANPPPPKPPLQTRVERNAARRARRKRNLDSVRKKAREQQARRYGSDPQFRILINLRSRLTTALRLSDVKKSLSTFSLLGCPAVWLQVHLESLFVPGMTWENYGPVWHVDHIKPCAKFDLTCPEQQKACFHWTNLQPLFAADNLRKNAAYDGP